jgi:hypothetical protein
VHDRLGRIHSDLAGDHRRCDPFVVGRQRRAVETRARADGTAEPDAPPGLARRHPGERLEEEGALAVPQPECQPVMAEGEARAVGDLRRGLRPSGVDEPAEPLESDRHGAGILVGEHVERRARDEREPVAQLLEGARDLFHADTVTPTTDIR